MESKTKDTVNNMKLITDSLGKAMVLFQRSVADSLKAAATVLAARGVWCVYVCALYVRCMCLYSV